MYTVVTFGNVAFIWESAAWSVPGWVVALLILLFVEGGLNNLPVLGVIVIGVFFMLVAIIEQLNLKKLVEEEKDDTPALIKYVKTFCSIAMNGLSFIIVTGSFLVNGAIENNTFFGGGGWMDPFLAIFLLEQVARVVIYLLAALFSWIFKKAGILVANIAGIIAYIAGCAGYIYLVFFMNGRGLEYLERLYYGISMVFGKGV